MISPRLRRRFIWAAMLTAYPLAQSAAAQGLAACKFEMRGSTSPAVAVPDGRSLRLADGREVRLAGLEVSGASKSALERLVLGKDILLTSASGATDRYGRIVAFAFVNGSETPVQYDLLSLGQARVSAQALGHDCTQALLGAERKAREGRLGVWGDPGYAIRAAADGVAFRSQQGLFSVAEGRVVSVRDSGGTIYLNFGSRWSEALTATILKQNERSFAGAGISPRTLEGRVIRIRGYVDVRAGPVIEASRPEQIEVVAR